MVKPYRINLTFTEEQTKKLTTYMVNIAKEQGRIPPLILTKLTRWAIDEWLERHSGDYDINWDSRE